jgi:predicted transcriptional regulator
VLALGDLRESLGVTQTELAGVLGVSQPNVSKLEGKDDIRLSTLGGYVAALGGGWWSGSSSPITRNTTSA